MPLVEPPEALADKLWNHLNGENRVALAVKAIDPSAERSTVSIRNRLAAQKKKSAARG
jgi:hypothetical protein